MRFQLVFFFILCSTALYAYDFSSTCASGQMLYYKIIDSVEYRVSLTFPGPSIDSAWQNYAQPVGELVIPSRVSLDGQQYIVAGIASFAFAKCTGLSGRLILPSSIADIGSYAFLHCNAIQTVVFNCVNCTSAFAAFEGCEFDSILLGDDVRIIPDGIFSNSNNVREIVVPDSVDRIGERAFYNCQTLTKVVMNSTCKFIGDFAFSDCPSLDYINLINADTVGDYAFYNTGIRPQVIFGDRVVSIGVQSFCGCGDLRSLTIGRKMSSIGDCSFSTAGLVDTVFCWASVPPMIGHDVFHPNALDNTLMVKCNPLGMYQVAEGWNSFSNVVADTSFSLMVLPNRSECGYVIGGGGVFCFGETTIVEAVPYYGYIFSSWVDGETVNPREITIQGNTLAVACFAADTITVSLCGNDCEECRVVLNGQIINISALNPLIISVYDVFGRCYYHSLKKEKNAICLLPSNGIYIVSFGNGAMRKVIVL